MISIIIFDEKKHSENIIKTGYYQTLKHQGKERRAMARYLKYELGYNNYEIVQAINKIRSNRQEMYNLDVWESIMEKVLDRFDDYDYIKNFKVGISEGELKVILEQPNVELRDLLFILLVYYKWARNIEGRVCVHNDTEWVKEEDIECCKIAGLRKLKKHERINLFNIFIQNGVYESNFFRRYNNIFMLPFVDDKKPVIVVDSYIDILAHLYNYLNDKICTRCSDCDVLIRKKTNNQKYCNVCSLSHYRVQNSKNVVQKKVL